MTLESIEDRAGDQRLLRNCVAAAIVLHLGLLLVRLPSSAAPLPPPPPDDSPRLIAPVLKPPPIEPPPAVATAGPRRPVPIPVPEPPSEMIEPQADPLADPRDAVFDPDAPEFIYDPSPQGPPSAGPLAEDTVGLVLPVAIPGRARPDYPEMARRIRLEGRVVLEAVIDTDGRVVSITVVSAPAVDIGFEEAAIRAVRQWRYEPGRYGGEPVAVKITVLVDFVLN